MKDGIFFPPFFLFSQDYFYNYFSDFPSLHICAFSEAFLIKLSNIFPGVEGWEYLGTGRALLMSEMVVGTFTGSSTGIFSRDRDLLGLGATYFSKVLRSSFMLALLSLLQMHIRITFFIKGEKRVGIFSYSHLKIASYNYLIFLFLKGTSKQHI